MDYDINEIGIKELKKRRKENNKLFFIFPLFSITYIILTYISMRGASFFWITSPILIIIYIFFGIVAPIIAAIRFNKVITNLHIENDRIYIETCKVNFKKEKIFEISFSDIKSIEERTISYGSGLSNGLQIRLYSNEDLYLIEKFCSNFVNMRTELKYK